MPHIFERLGTLIRGFVAVTIDRKNNPNIAAAPSSRHWWHVSRVRAERLLDASWYGQFVFGALAVAAGAVGFETGVAVGGALCLVCFRAAVLVGQ